MLLAERVFAIQSKLFLAAIHLVFVCVQRALAAHVAHVCALHIKHIDYLKALDSHAKVHIQIGTR